MSPEVHSQMAGFIWGICDLLRGPYKRNEYRKVILPLTVLRRFDSILAPTKQDVLDAYGTLAGKGENIVRARLCEVSGERFYNLSRLDFPKLLNDPNQLAPNLSSYVNAFSPNVDRGGLPRPRTGCRLSSGGVTLFYGRPTPGDS